MEPRNRCQSINSASICSLAGRYDNPIPTRCLAPIDFFKIPAQNVFQKLSRTEQRREGVAAYLWLSQRERERDNKVVYRSHSWVEITINVPDVHMARDIMILMRENPFQGPLEGVGPENQDNERFEYH
jgi:hypothetical protein